LFRDAPLRLIELFAIAQNMMLMFIRAHFNASPGRYRHWIQKRAMMRKRTNYFWIF
jgi:hypothetical protein